MVPQERFRKYVTLLELIPPMPNDKSVWKRGIAEAQQYLMGRECQGVMPDTIPFIAIIVLNCPPAIKGAGGTACVETVTNINKPKNIGLIKPPYFTSEIDQYSYS